MPRPKKSINFRCPKCRKEYMAEQDPHKNWPKDKVNWRFCQFCRDQLFKNDHYRHVIPDYDMEIFGVYKHTRGLRV